MSRTFLVGPRGPGGLTNAGNGAAIYLPRRKHPTLMIQNSGSLTVFCDDEDPLTNPSIGQPVTAGSTLVWDEDRPLYVTCPDGESTLVLTENSGNLFDVSALAGAIAVDLNSSGLAQSIAQNISVSGAPPIDALTMIDNSGVFSGGAGYASGPIDARKWQSVQQTFSNGFPTRISPGRVQLAWYTNSTMLPSELLGYDEYFVGTGALTSFATPVQGPWFQVLIDSGFASTGGGQMKTYGSYKARSSSLYKGQGAGSTQGTVEGSTDMGFQLWSGTIPANTTWNWQPGVVAGENMFVTRFVSNGNISVLVRNANYTLGTYANYLTATSGANDSYKYFFPPGPIDVQFTNGSAAISFRFVLTPLRPYVS